MPNPDPAVTPPATPPPADPSAPPPATPPADPPAAPPATDPPAGDPDVWDHDRGMATITKLRGEIKEAKKSGARVSELEAELKTIKDAQLTEEQKVARERDELLAQQETWQREKRDTTLKLAVYGLQNDLAIADSDLAIAALDHSQVEWSNDGQPSNIEALLTDLLERKPLLKSAGAPPRVPRSDGPQGSGSQPPPDLTAEEAEFARSQGIAPERYAQMKQVKSIDDFEKLKTS